MKEAETNEIKASPLQEIEELPTKVSSRIYLVLCFTNILLNIDQGVLPACTNELMQDLNLEEVKFGMLGSLLYIGLIGGSFLAGYIFQKFSNKKVIMVNLVLMGFCLSVFTFTKNFYFLAASRILTGFFQVFLVIFFPVWVDLFGEDRKTIWLSILQVGVPLGTFLGYILTVFSVAVLNWKWGFWLQIILLVPSFLALLTFDEKNLDTQHSNEKNNEDSENSISYSLEIINEENLINDHDLLQLNRSSKLFGDEGSSELTYFGSLLLVMRSRIFLCTMLAISALYFIVTGIQYWMTDYLRNVMKQDKNLVFLTYSILSLTAPTFGALFGGYYVNRNGGYNSKSALKICVHFGIFAVLCAYPFPFVPFYTLAVVLLWFLLFFGGALMPSLTGIMISSVPKQYRAFGNSTAQIFLNLFGFLPAPFLYGLLCELTGGRDSQWGMVLVMFWSIFGLGAVTLAYLHDKGKRDKKEINNEKIKKNEVEEKEKNGQKIAVEFSKSKSLCVRSERKLTEPLIEKSFETKFQNKSADAGKIGFHFGLGIQKSILNSFDFSQIAINKRKSEGRKMSGHSQKTEKKQSIG